MKYYIYKGEKITKEEADKITCKVLCKFGICVVGVITMFVASAKLIRKEK